MKNKTKRIDLMASTSDEKNLQQAAAKLGTTKLSQTIFKSVEATAKKVEYGCDRPAIKDTLANIDYCRANLQSILNEVKQLTGAILTRDELENALKGIGKLGSAALLEEALRDMITEKLYQKLVKTNPGFTVTVDLIKMPDLSRLFELSDLLDNAPRIKLNFVGCYWSAYQISEAGRVTIIQNEVDRITAGYRFTASGPDELRKLSIVNGLCDCLNKIMEDPEVLPDKVFNLVYWDSEARRYSPSGSYIKFNLQPRIVFERKTI